MRNSKFVESLHPAVGGTLDLMSWMMRHPIDTVMWVFRFPVFAFHWMAHREPSTACRRCEAMDSKPCCENGGH